MKSNFGKTPEKQFIFAAPLQCTLEKTTTFLGRRNRFETELKYDLGPPRCCLVGVFSGSLLFHECRPAER